MAIGLVVGAGAMYLVLRPPWGGDNTSSPGVDAGHVAQAPNDAGVAKKPGGKRPRRPSGGGRQSPGADFLPDSTDETEPAPVIQLSAADRALEWRGDQTSISRTIDMNAPDNARPLEQGEINSTVSSQSGGVRRCVEQGAAGVDLRGATITIKMVVEGNGTVSRSQLQAPHYLFQKGLLACAQRALRSMHFPSTGTPTLVTFPVNLN